MTSNITVLEIKAVFTADGGELARRLHRRICDGLDENEATQIETLMAKLVEEGFVKEDHPLRSEKYRLKWDKEIRKSAEKVGVDLTDPKTPAPEHSRTTRLAVRWWLEQIFPSLNPTAADNNSAPSSSVGNGAPGKASGPRHDLITGRRTAKKNYGECLAQEWGRTLPGAVSANLVADQYDKLGYDVRVTLADDREVHIEAKATGGDGDVVAIEEGERKHNQESGCEHEDVLFVVSGVKSEEVNGKWTCSGGNKLFKRDWRIASSDLTPQPSWLYKVPQSMSVWVEDDPDSMPPPAETILAEANGGLSSDDIPSRPIIGSCATPRRARPEGPSSSSIAILMMPAHSRSTLAPLPPVPQQHLGVHMANLLSLPAVICQWECRFKYKIVT